MWREVTSEAPVVSQPAHHKDLRLVPFFLLLLPNLYIYTHSSTTPHYTTTTTTIDWTDSRSSELGRKTSNYINVGYTTFLLCQFSLANAQKSSWKRWTRRIYILFYFLFIFFFDMVSPSHYWKHRSYLTKNKDKYILQCSTICVCT